MSFLPGTLTPALLRSCHRKVISHSDGHSVVGCRKIKRADYTEHQKSAGAWLSLQNDVLCNRLWRSKSSSAFFLLPPSEPKAWWSSSALFGAPNPCRADPTFLNMVEHLYSVVYVAGDRCAIIIQIMCYAVKVASPFTIFLILLEPYKSHQNIVASPL